MYQQITLIGNLGSDPVMRMTTNGTPVTSFSLAVNKTWTQNGEKHDKTTWFRITCWRKLAETVQTYLRKGSQVCVIGEVETPKVYTNRAGESATGLEVTANLVKFLGGRGNSADMSTEFLAISDDDEDVPF